ncbi:MULTISPECIES: hypothetical protein [unclassified Microcoleus]|uniref:hypothetical protein n=1 Tax=unclassified Microcoleus TaxID=2642155 RepID=UPI002FD0EF93
MAWLDLGIVFPDETIWRQTNQSAIDQDLIRLTYISTGVISSIKSRLLVRRLWRIDGELPIEEKANVVYPSPNRILLNLPVLADYVASGLATYKIQVKRYYPFRRSIISEPLYALKVEVN